MLTKHHNTLFFNVQRFFKRICCVFYRVYTQRYLVELLLCNRASMKGRSCFAALII